MKTKLLTSSELLRNPNQTFAQSEFPQLAQRILSHAQRKLSQRQTALTNLQQEISQLQTHTAALPCSAPSGPHFVWTGLLLPGANRLLVVSTAWQTLYRAQLRGTPPPPSPSNHSQHLCSPGPNRRNCAAHFHKALNGLFVCNSPPDLY